MRIHDIRHLDGQNAYAYTQSSRGVKHGDVLLVEDGIAVMIQEWPTMVVGTSRNFHELSSGWTWEQVAAYRATQSVDAGDLMDAVAYAEALALAGGPAERFFDVQRPRPSHAGVIHDPWGLSNLG